MRIKAIYDNGGETIDRYTVVFHGIIRTTVKGYGAANTYPCLCLSDSPDSPQGVSQWDRAIWDGDNDHLGKLVRFRDLPENIKAHIKERMKEA